MLCEYNILILEIIVYCKLNRAYSVPQNAVTIAGKAKSKVHFRDLSLREIDRYIDDVKLTLHDQVNLRSRTQKRFVMVDKHSSTVTLILLSEY